MRRLMVLSAAIATALATVAAPVASANTVDTFRAQFTISLPVTNVCPFPIDFTAQQDVVQIVQVAPDGAATFLSTIHEVDTFMANGRTLVSQPFTAHTVFAMNAAGDVTKIALTGIIEKVYVSSGRLFISAGFVVPAISFIFAPDHGVTGDVNAFCASLAP